jgi:hypothetical protein
MPQTVLHRFLNCLLYTGRQSCAASACILACFASAFATACSNRRHQTRGSRDRNRTARAYQAYAAQGPLALQAFLAQFPKGADLHVHLSGAVYAESFIRDAAEDGLCVDPAALKFAKPALQGKLIPAPSSPAIFPRQARTSTTASSTPSPCAASSPPPGFSGHDQFFATFDRFGGLNKRHTGEWVDEVASRSAAQNQQYLELMQTPPFGHAATVAHQARLGTCPDLPKAAPGPPRPRPARRSRRRSREMSARRGPAPPDRALRNAAGRARLPGRDPLHLPDPARLFAGAGLRPNAARL